MKLISIYEFPDRYEFLYRLLEERTPNQSISHKEMPSHEQHESFIDSMPYDGWYFLYDGLIFGTIYITSRREVGIQLFNKFQGQGLGKQAIKLLRELHPGELYANINPKNKRSIKFFNKLGAKHIQNTYLLK